MRIDDLRPRHRLGVDRVRRRAVPHPRHAVQRVGHVLGGEGRAVVETDVAQRDLPGAVVAELPGEGEAGDQFARGGTGHQALEEMRTEGIVGGKGVVVRVDARHRRRGGNAQGLGLCLLRDE